MDDLVNTVLLTAIGPGALTGLLAGWWRGGMMTAIVTAVAGGALGLGCAMLANSSLGSAGPGALVAGSIAGGLIAASIVPRLLASR